MRPIVDKQLYDPSSVVVQQPSDVVNLTQIVCAPGSSGKERLVSMLLLNDAKESLLRASSLLGHHHLPHSLRPSCGEAIGG